MRLCCATEATVHPRTLVSRGLVAVGMAASSDVLLLVV